MGDKEGDRARSYTEREMERETRIEGSRTGNGERWRTRREREKKPIEETLVK
jgi:hypothetical protein